jgi:hypothetical protein
VAGGLVGFNNGTISNSYARGPVSNGRAGMGGLVGVLYAGTVKASYSTGLVSGGKPGHTGGMAGLTYAGTSDQSYWDLDTSGQRKSAAGIRLTDRKLRSHLPPGFDPNVWGQSQSINNGYPYLVANPPPP